MIEPDTVFTMGCHSTFGMAQLLELQKYAEAHNVSFVSIEMSEDQMISRFPEMRVPVDVEPEYKEPFVYENRASRRGGKTSENGVTKKFRKQPWRNK